MSGKLILKGKTKLTSTTGSVAEAAKKFSEGPEWIKVIANRASASSSFRIELASVDGDTGDLERYRPAIVSKDGKRRWLMKENVAWAVASPDGKFVAYEPLTLVDVRNWTEYDVSTATGLPNYISILYWSKDGKSLIINQRECAYECAGYSIDIWRIDLK